MKKNYSKKLRSTTQKWQKKYWRCRKSKTKSMQFSRKNTTRKWEQKPID